MKKTVTLKVNDREVYELGFTLKSLSRAERLLGHSILSIFSGSLADILARATIDFTVNMLMTGLEIDQDKAYEIIDAFCVENSIDELNGIIINSIMQTGLFTKRSPETAAPTPEVSEAATEKQKKTKKK